MTPAHGWRLGLRQRTIRRAALPGIVYRRISHKA